MSSRSAEEIRLEIAAERERLVDDVAALRKEMRKTIPFALAAVVVLAVLSRDKGVNRATKLLWKLR